MMSVDVKKCGDVAIGDPLMKGLMQADRNNEIRTFAKKTGILLFQSKTLMLYTEFRMTRYRFCTMNTLQAAII